MPLETGTFISDLVAANPPGTDLKSQGDDHLRLIKSTVKNTFPNVTGAMTLTHTQINALVASSARAFCVFNGISTGTNAPLSGLGVTSVTRNSAGNYTVTLGTAYSDNLFVVNATADNGAVNQTYWAAASTSTITIANYVAGVPTDTSRIFITAFRATA